MLNRVSTVLQSAADALAPPAPPLEDLKYHWKLVMRFYSQRSVHSKTPIEETNIPAHLEQILKILINEENNTRKEGNSGSCIAAGPCLEYLLQHRLLELLASLACADSPPGMRRYLLDYLRRFVRALSPHLLTHTSIHLPLVRIVNLCSQSKASPTEPEEISFLVSLCQIVHNNPYLTLIFNKEVKGERHSSISSSASSSGQNQVNLCQSLQSVDLNTHKLQAQSQTESNNDEDSSVKLHGNATSPPENPVEHLPSESDSSTLKQKVENHSSKEKEIHEEGASDKVEAKKDDLLDQLFRTQSQTTTRSGTPESLMFADSYDYQELEGEGKLPLLDAVLGYINSADSKTKLNVCESLLLLVSVADETFSSAIVRTSNLSLVLAEKLSSSLQEIPLDIHPDDLEDIPSAWGPDTSQMWLEQHVFPGSRLVASFVSWLNFCDQISVEAPREVADSISCAVRALFFEVELESELRSENCQRKQLITNIISLCLRHLTSHALLSELNSWLVEDSREADSVGPNSSSVNQLLLNNCLHSDTHLSLATLRLFEVLLENCNERVLYCLVFSYLTKRGYCNPNPSRINTTMESWSDEEDAREQQRELNREAKSQSDSKIQTAELPDVVSVSRTFAPSNIHKIIDSFLMLVPPNLRSASGLEESGYTQYVAEAQRQYLLSREHCFRFGWPSEANFPDETENSSDSHPEADHLFFEGPFLRMIFTRLRGLPRQPYEMNLQLTALVSRLAMLPHAHLHEFLLNPLLPHLPGTTSLYSTLQEVANELHVQVSPIPNCKKLLLQTRQQLLGDVSPYEILPESCCLLESVIVLEEFCKELAAITYVKYHQAS